MACNDKPQVDIDMDIHLSFVNADGEDLLDTNIENSINSSEINLYYLINNVKVREYVNRMENHSNLNVRYSDSLQKNVLTVVINYHLDENNQSITFLELNENDTDTIKCDIARGSNLTYITTVWYNDQLLITNQQDDDLVVITK